MSEMMLMRGTSDSDQLVSSLFNSLSAAVNDCFAGGRGHAELASEFAEKSGEFLCENF